MKKWKPNYFCSIIFCLSVTVSAFSQFSTCPIDGFGGNKRVIFSAISPQIHLPDIMGEAPFAIYVSASPTTATGAGNAYTDIEYSWNFGDISVTGNYTFIHPVDNATMFANTDQKGPEAAYLYKTPGIYTITLTARAWNGSTFITASTTTSVTINSWSGQDRYFDPVNGNDANLGTSTATPWQSWAQLVAWLRGGNNRRVLLKRGTTMAVNSTLSSRESGIRIAAYDTGNNPILLTDIGMGGGIISINGSNGHIIRDHVYTDITMNLNDTATSAFSGFANNTGGLERVIFANCEIKNGTNSLIYTTGAGQTKRSFMLWDCSFDANQGAKQSFGPADNPYVAVIGGLFIGGDGDPIKDHHMYIHHCDHTIIRWVKFGEAISRNYCLNMNAPSYNDDFVYTLIDGCDITGTNNGIDFSNTNIVTNDKGHFTQTIVQNCAIHDLTFGNQGYGILPYSIRDLTVRNCWFYNNPVADIAVQDDFGMIYSVYKNKFHTSASNPHNAIVIKPGQSGSFTDNIFVNEATWGYHFSGELATTSDWVIDNNQYWHPNVTNPFSVGGSASNYATWQGMGYDPNGIILNPGFPDPSNGDFGSSPTANFSDVITSNTVTFTNNSTGSLTPTYLWDFNDTNTSLLTDPVHTYASSGTYNVQLTTSNACGVASFNKNITVGVLPIEWIYFKARPLNNSSVLLEWGTDQEDENKGFEVQRSIDGKIFNTIDWVDSNGGGAYNYLDNISFQKEYYYYYRLKQVDIDDEFEFSKTITAYFIDNKLNTFTFFPNPAKDFLYLKTSHGTVVHAKIFNTLGVAVWQKSFVEEIKIKLSFLQIGTYFLKVVDVNGRVDVKIFVKAE